MSPAERVAQGVVEGPVVLVEAVAMYQRVGDGPGMTWAQWVLAEAAANDDITDDWTIYGEWSASWVQVIVFTFRTHMPCDAEGCVPGDDAQRWAEEMAAHIVGESDVQVLGLKVVGDDDDEEEDRNAADSQDRAYAELERIDGT